MENFKTFIQACIDGTAIPEQIDDWIDKWYDNMVQSSLHLYLGITVTEYVQWVKNEITIEQVIERYKPQIRCSGRTTRLVDQMVQEFFTTGECVVRDHYIPNMSMGDIKNLMRVAHIITYRLRTEHNLDEVADFKIKNQKGIISIVKC